MQSNPHPHLARNPFPLVGVAACVSGSSLLAGLLFWPSFSQAFRGVGHWVMFSIAVYLTLWGIREVIQATRPQTLASSRSWNRHRMSATREGFAYIVIMSVMFVGSILGRSNMLMLVFAMMIGPWVLNGWIAFTMLKRMRVRRLLPHRATVGERTTIDVEVVNQKLLLSSWLVSVRDLVVQSQDLFQATVLFVRVPPRQTRQASYSIQFQRRGVYSFGPLELFTQYPLGLIERGLRMDDLATLIVHPAAGRLTARWQQELWHVGSLAEHRRSRRGLFDDEFNRIREYRSGDNPRAIHWKTTARLGDLMVREYHQMRDRELVLLVELWQPDEPSGDDVDRVELAISFVATIARERFCQRHEFGLEVIVCGQETMRWTQQSQGELLLDQLAMAQPSRSADVKELAVTTLERLHAQSQLVLVSSRSSEDVNSRFNVLREGGSAVCLSSDPETLASVFQLETLA